ncbi:MAG: nucleotidyl transferase AbiEii/AbiGii toxin family protein [Actinomycetota bacterium]
MIPLSELKTKAAQSRVDISVLERGYVIGWVLEGIFDDPSLSESLVFKGGTALRKVYFPAYRFSEDPDFTMVKSLAELGKDQIRASLDRACKNVYEQSGIELMLADFRQTRDELDEEAFLGKIQYVGPRRHRAGNPPRVKLDMTLYEKVLLEPNNLPLMHPYSDAEDCYAVVSTYRLEEIVAEKLRAILQRTRSRDIYDLWYFLKYHKDALNLVATKDVFRKKCEYKGVDFKGIEDFFKPELLESHKLAWEPSMKRQVINLPPFAEVEDDLRLLLGELF